MYLNYWEINNEDEFEIFGNWGESDNKLNYYGSLHHSPSSTLLYIMNNKDNKPIKDLSGYFYGEGFIHGKSKYDNKEYNIPLKVTIKGSIQILSKNTMGINQGHGNYINGYKVITLILGEFMKKDAVIASANLMLSNFSNFINNMPQVAIKPQKIVLKESTIYLCQAKTTNYIIPDALSIINSQKTTWILKLINKSNVNNLDWIMALQEKIIKWYKLISNSKENILKTMFKFNNQPVLIIRDTLNKSRIKDYNLNRYIYQSDNQKMKLLLPLFNFINNYHKYEKICLVLSESNSDIVSKISNECVMLEYIFDEFYEKEFSKSHPRITQKKGNKINRTPNSNQNGYYYKVKVKYVLQKVKAPTDQVLNYLNSVVGTEEINLNKLAKIIRDIRVSGVHDRSIGKNGQSHLLINSEEGVYYLNHILTILLKSWLFTIIKMPENSIKNITDNIGITIIKG